MLLSLSLYSFRPYKVTQQALGDLMQSIGDYICMSRRHFIGKIPIMTTYIQTCWKNKRR